MFNTEALKEHSREELFVLAGKMGMQVHPDAPDDLLRKQIIEKALLRNNDENQMKHVAELPSKPVHKNLPDEVEAAIADIKKRQPKFQSTYNEEENTWRFDCLGASESGNLAIPLRVIVMKANNVSRGRHVLRGLNEHFDKTNSSAKNAYTDNVLQG